MSGYGMNAAMALNQQFMMAVGLAQQASMAEQSGFLPVALSNWEQASMMAGNAVTQSLAAMIPVTGPAYAGLAEIQFHVARLKTHVGRGMESAGHLAIAMQAIQAAIAQMPGWGPFHGFAGRLYLCSGNIPAAMQELGLAVQLNPADAASQALLRMTQSQMMPVPDAPIGFPGMPTPSAPATTPGTAPESGAKGWDLERVLSVTKQFLDVAQGVSNLMGSNTANQNPAWPQPGFGWPPSGSWPS